MSQPNETDQSSPYGGDFPMSAGRVPVQAGVSAPHYGKLVFFAPSLRPL